MTTTEKKQGGNTPPRLNQRVLYSGTNKQSHTRRYNY